MWRSSSLPPPSLLLHRLHRKPSQVPARNGIAALGKPFLAPKAELAVLFLSLADARACIAASGSGSSSVPGGAGGFVAGGGAFEGYVEELFFVGGGGFGVAAFCEIKVKGGLDVKFGICDMGEKGRKENKRKGGRGKEFEDKQTERLQKFAYFA